LAEVYRIREYQSFTREITPSDDRFVPMDRQSFDVLEAFVLANQSVDEPDAVELMTLSDSSDVGKIISVRNYVGALTLTDGTKIQILPKLYTGDAEPLSETKRLFFEMLRTVKELPCKLFDYPNLLNASTDLFDCFVRMFLDEVIHMSQRGLRSSYIISNDRPHLHKSSLAASPKTQTTVLRTGRQFADYDSFGIDCPENRLLKSTLCYLLKKTTNVRNHKDCAMLLPAFDRVANATNYEAEFSKCIIDRSRASYENALRWCRVFMMNRRFTAYLGCEVTYSLLFPMQTAFESYVGAVFDEILDSARFSLQTRDRGLYLFRESLDKLAVRPDVLITDQRDGGTIVVDTKWEQLSPAYPNFGISQADINQMYIFGEKYQAKQLLVLYPLNKDVLDLREPIRFTSDSGVTVRVEFVDLKSPAASLRFIGEG